MRLARWCMLLGIALAPAGGCSTNPSTGRSQFILPMVSAQAEAMGEAAKPQMIEEFGGEVPSGELRGYVARVGSALAGHVEPEFAHIQWEFITLDSNVVNAFALPGGKVFITRGLLSRFTNEAQVAAVLGHEIGHVTAKHVDERLSQAMVAQIGLAAVGAMTEYQLVQEGANLATQVALLGFSREQESESDRQGLKYMTAAGYDPQGMAQVMQVLAEASGGERDLEILSTHPYPETRLAEVRALLQSQYAYAMGNPAYRLYPDRFDADARPYLP